VRAVVDTGAIVAALDQRDPEQDRFRQALDAATSLFITPLVAAETHYLLSSLGARAAAAGFLRDIASGYYTLYNPDPADYSQAAALIEQYQGQMQRKRYKPGSLDLADAMNVIVAAKTDTNVLLASDQDYRTVTPLSRHPAFAIAPYDAA